MKNKGPIESVPVKGRSSARDTRRVRTMEDIARIAGVSKKSVSRVLNDDKGISDSTRARIKQIMNDTNYQPDRRARALAGSRTYLIGIAYNNPNPAYIVKLMGGFQEAASQHGYELVMYHVATPEEEMARDIEKFMRRSRCDAILLSPPLSESAALLGSAELQGLVTARIASDDVNLDIPQVRYDDRSAAMQITRYLVDLGHETIGFVGGPRTGGPTRRRLAGFCDVLKLTGRSPSSSLQAFGEFSFRSGLESGRQLLSSPQRPTAIACCNDELAAGVVHAARELGLSVPEDLSVSGFDDLPLAEQVWPPLTSVRQPVHKMAAAAADALIDKLSQTPNSSSVQEFGPELVVRASTSPK